jgi:hypothetical protein
LSPLGTAATNRPIVPAPGDYDDGEFGGMNGRGNRSTQRKPALLPLCPPQNPTCCSDTNLGRRVGKPATNRLSYGTAFRWAYVGTTAPYNEIPVINYCKAVNFPLKCNFYFNTNVCVYGYIYVRYMFFLFMCVRAIYCFNILCCRLFIFHILSFTTEFI